MKTCIKKNQLTEGYAVLIWTDEGNYLYEVLGKRITDDLAVVWNDITDRYSIITIGSGMYITPDVYTLPELNKFLDKTDLGKYIARIKEKIGPDYERKIKMAEQIYHQFIAENRWYDG